MIRTVTGAALAVLLASGAHAAPTVIESRSEPGVTLSFQQAKICELTPGVKSFSGYITLPATLDPAIQPYDASFFFWFFESRILSDSAPVTLWLQGGPGLASVNQAVSGHNGPCKVKHDSNSTELNLLSWNNFSNMLYLDQPVQTGFSYDTVTTGYKDMFSAEVSPGPISGPGNVTYRPGKFGSGDMSKTANTTAIAARAVTHFMDLWGQQNPKYKRDKINIWSQSYGGFYAPSLATQLLQQNKIGVSSVGIIDGVIDLLIQAPAYPQFAVNNTYGIKAISDAQAADALNAFYQPGGARDQTIACKALQAQYDPNDYGNNLTVNNICNQAIYYGLAYVYGPYEAFSNRHPNDIGHVIPDSFPPPYAIGYLNNAWVQNALGVKVNFSETSPTVNHAFFSTGDYARGYTKNIADLLAAGVKVALMHGDRDYVANWFGGEDVSLAIPWSKNATFANAGYADIKIPLSPNGGLVRQVGSLSFSRVFQAGHEMPYYQPAVALALFARTILGLDAATGTKFVTGGYATTGPKNIRGVPAPGAIPPQAPPECYVDAAPLANSPSRCTSAQLAALQAGTAVVNSDRVVVVPAA
ncbi:alpha/beta-hydrolase [Coniochaeta ligniaria NRRL 30616]|uniref:Alpha/beta-hydrolase n=1 Tax=Coniochaeta ligniaria NRRL 30616 TaxID=1408157 RepID=A0A1J7JP61_9PEZI|nr:alpha/beta-hydrolase [Coniochaeta ligniaria NRRL 30616]